MSKIAEQLKAVLYRTGSAEPMRHVDVHLESVPYSVGGSHIRVGAKLHADAFVSDSIYRKTPLDQHAVISDLSRGIIEEVFGEFRPMFAELRVAIYDRDQGKAREILCKIESKMFDL